MDIGRCRVTVRFASSIATCAHLIAAISISRMMKKVPMTMRLHQPTGAQDPNVKPSRHASDNTLSTSNGADCRAGPSPLATDNADLREAMSSRGSHSKPCNMCISRALPKYALYAR